MTPAELMKTKREELNLTQREFAHLLKLGRNGERTIRRWESGETEPAELYVYHVMQLAPEAPFARIERAAEVAEAGEDGADAQAGEGSSAAGNAPAAPFTFVDLFAGIGGMHLAFGRAGGTCVYANEWDRFCQIQYRANFGVTPAGDITKVDAADIPDHDVLVAGFPCQPFSIAGVSKKRSLGRETGFLDKTQGTLFFDVARIVREKRPRAFMLENVKNLKSHDRGRTWATIEETLESLDYEVFSQVLDAQDFVPQHRERIIIVGFDRRRYGDGVEFFFDLRKPRDKPVLADILEEDASAYTLSDTLWEYLQAYAAKHRAKGNGFGYGLASPDGISRTLSARYYKDGSEILIPQEGRNPRKLTPRECARLQGYPDEYRICVSDTQAYRQFGNSVAVPLIQEVARLIAGKLAELEGPARHPGAASGAVDVAAAAAGNAGTTGAEADVAAGSSDVAGGEARA